MKTSLFDTLELGGVDFLCLQCLTIVLVVSPTVKKQLASEITIEINMIVIFTYAIISSDAKELFLWVDVSLLLTRFSSEISNSEFCVCILLRVKQTHYALKIIPRIQYFRA